MNNWGLLQILLNILFAGGVGYCVLRFRKEDQFSRGRESNRDELAAFKVTLEKTVREGHKLSDRIVEDVESRQKDLSVLTQVIENEKKALMVLLEEVKFAGYSSQNFKQKFQEPWINDKYSKALKLSAEGFSTQQIADRINLPLGEIELVLSLRK
jgi:hypothetical protein